MIENDAFTQEIIKNALVAIGDEMFAAMAKTSMSPIMMTFTMAKLLFSAPARAWVPASSPSSDAGAGFAWS